MREIKFRAWDKLEKKMVEVVRLSCKSIHGKVFEIIWDVETTNC